MNVLILGRNEINKALVSRVREQGFTPVIIEDVDDVKSFNGECGNFTVKSGTDEINAAAVIITETPDKPMTDIGGALPVSFFDDAAMQKISGSGTRGPVAVLLDYYNESSSASTVKALEVAMALAAKKQNVVFIFKFLRTAGMDTEELYSRARNMGVSFIKYESLDISYEKDGNFFNVNVSDGINDVNVSAKYVITDNGYGVSESFLKLAKKLRIKVNEAGYINEDRYFLNPSLTSRKGVYCLNRDVSADRLEDAVDYIIASAVYDAGCDKPEKNHAVIDGEKCAFCYTCYRACPHAAMEPDEEDRVMKNKNAACEGCGTCASVCPGNAIIMSDDRFDENCREGKRGKIKIFCCENSGDIALQSILPELGEKASKIDFETMPCGGRMGFEQLSGALRFYGKVIILVCMDDACRHFDGNKRACRQADRLASMLEKAGIDSGRVCCIKISHAMENVLKDSILEEIK